VTERDLAPRTVGELLDASFFVYRRQFARLVLVAMIVSLPALLVAVMYADGAAAALRSFWDDLMSSVDHNRGGDFLKALEDSNRATAKIQGFALLMGVLQSIERAGGAVTMAVVAAAALRREALPSIATIFREALPRLPAAVLVQVVLDYLLGMCMGCCFPIGIVLTVMLSVTAVAIALERGPMETSVRAGVPAALSWAVVPFAAAVDGVVRSMRLTANAQAIARGTAFIFFLLTFVGIADGVAMGLGAWFAGGSGGWFWAQHCSEALVLPAWGLGAAFWHADLRARREGADLEPAAT
jgi:hypothetical protein